MKNQKKCRKGIYRLALLLTVLCSAVGGYAQTQDDLKLVDPGGFKLCNGCLLYTSPSPRDRTRSRMPSSA